MKSEGLKVPNDIRTLMKTPKTHNIVNITNGSYIHLGIENMLLPILNKNNANIYVPYHVLKIGINIDGLPISKSSKSQLWPILISVLNFKELINNVVAVGIYHGDKKPNSIEEFMNPFVLDILSIMNSGLNVNGTLMKLEISNIVCDAPAKSFLLNVKSHNAYFGCTSCLEEGTYVSHRVVFPGVDSTLRTDYSFRNRLNEDYHKGPSPLELLPIDIVDTVCLDYMHNVCLGVTKRLVELWVKGKKDIRMVDNNIQEVNNALLKLREYVPSEFCRLPRPLSDIEFWKATELRFFLLYSGPIVLKGKLKKNQYSHYLLLVFAIRILLCTETCYTLNENAEFLLKKFVQEYPMLYGEHFMSYNVHSLIHLPKFVKTHGSLDNFSCFRYENYLQKIKNCLKSTKYPLQETHNRLVEKQKLELSQQYETPKMYTTFNEIEHHLYSPFYCINDKLFEKIVFNYSRLTIDISKEKNKYLLLKDNSLVVVNKIVEKNLGHNINLLVKKFLNFKEFIAIPLSSIDVGIYIVNVNEPSNSYLINISDVKYKMFCVRLCGNSSIMVTLCHNVQF